MDQLKQIMKAVAEFDHHHSEGAQKQRQGFSSTFTFFYEGPSDEPDAEEIWCYSNRISYAPGAEVSLHISSTADKCHLKIERDGADPDCVLDTEVTELERRETPDDAYARGCGWPVSYRWVIPDDARSGFYKITVRIPGKWRDIVQHHFFVVRAAFGAPQSKALLLLPTATWCAYNDWGGANAYEGVAGADNASFSPHLSYQRPFARGIVWLPKSAPRFSSHEPRPPGSAPRYPSFEYGYANGFAKYFAAAGWAQFDRHFVVWAEQAGYEFDYATQTDLHMRPKLLDDYQTVVIVGHDEYWSGEMRDAIDGFVDDGGNVARFGGNFIWQIRMEDDGETQVCHKWLAHEEDPVMQTDPSTLTSVWADPIVNRPGGRTFGLDGSSGGYVAVGNTTPRWPGGYVVYRPRHWALEGTDLHYGDMFGQEAKIYSYEVDGAKYTFKNGQPFATGDDGAPKDLEIIAMGPACSYEPDLDADGAIYFLLYADVALKALLQHGEMTADTFEKAGAGSGMMAFFKRGKGQVFNAGSCEWIMGLRHGDWTTERITRNVLDRFLGESM